MNDSPPASSAAPSSPDLDALRDLYARSRDHLEACRRDPRGIDPEEDPRTLLAAIQRAFAGAPEEPTAPEPPQKPLRGQVHQLRARQSA